MRVNIRRPAIVLSLLSAFYWLTFQSFGQFVFSSQTASHQHPDMWVVWLLTGLPAIVYAIACLLFCHWLARRVARQVATFPKD
ncbi:MAG: hypothetical protein JWN66_220 [Sphingomonas bacterium]|uniref:hypothetical protein n=1 Tax=Sphingomonas bacterium TaxID=1895847 RepID=UPI0026247513|nr:hypothetical protein [Sphingomonas bacterium]MDB5703104.1 hypothetical protein [Sphingomonas bacterium]